MNLRVVSIICVWLWSGCAHNTMADPLVLSEGESPTRLQLINGETFHKTVFAPGLSGLDKTKEDEIRQQCKGPEKVPEFAFIPLTFLIGPAIDFVLDYVDKTLEERLKDYIAAYSGSLDANFYQSAGPDGPSTAWTCFRFSRAIKQGGKDKIVMDLLGQIVLTEEKDAIKVRPLRLYIVQAKAKGDQIGISFSLKAEAVWRQFNRGVSEKIFEYKVLSEKADISSGKPVVMYYMDSDWDSHPRLPLIPWSTNREGSLKGGNVTLTMTAAEVGMPPKLLEYATKLFTKNKGDLAQLMKDSAQKLYPATEK